MNIKIQIDSVELRKVVLTHLKQQVNYPLEEEDIVIRVKTSQNHKAEWEEGDFEAIVDKHLFIY